jgi:hypothetical protein
VGKLRNQNIVIIGTLNGLILKLSAVLPLGHAMGPGFFNNKEIK